MSYCVWTLADHDGNVRFVGTGTEDDPLLAFKKIEHTGVLQTGLGDWLDGLDAPPIFSVVLNGVDAVEADRASKALIARLPNLLNRGYGTRGGKGKRVVMIFRNGRVRWFPTQSAACRWLGVKWNGIDLAGRVLSKRLPRSAGPCGKSPPRAECGESLARAGFGESLARAGCGEGLPRAGCDESPPAEKKHQKPRKVARSARYQGVLTLREEHFGGISARVLAD